MLFCVALHLLLVLVVLLFAPLLCLCSLFFVLLFHYLLLAHVVLLFAPLLLPLLFSIAPRSCSLLLPLVVCSCLLFSISPCSCSCFMSCACFCLLGVLCSFVKILLLLKIYSFKLFLCNSFFAFVSHSRPYQQAPANPARPTSPQQTQPGQQIRTLTPTKSKK